MKALNNTFIIISILLLSIMVGCKKKNAVPDVVTTEITSSELLDYYIVAENKIENNRLTILSFSQEGSIIKVNGHVQKASQVRDLAMKNNAFNFDLFGDGRSIYSFSIEKDDAGKLKLKSYGFKFNGQANELDYAILIKKVATYSFANNAYYFMNDRNIPLSKIKEGTFFSINNDNIWLPASNTFIPIHQLTGISFRSNDSKYIGVAVPYWKDTDIPIVLLEFNKSLLIALNQ